MAKQQVSLLEIFPPDIWAYIVCYLPGEQLGRLIMTGAMFLGQRLKSIKVVKSIKLGENFDSFKSCPTFLRYFPSLEELSIHSCSNDESHRSCIDIDSIPSGVRKLEISGSWNDYVGGLFGANEATLKLNEHLPHIEVLGLEPLIFRNYSWMVHSPPSLTNLSLHRWNGDVELPACLIDFRAMIVSLSTDSFVAKLPPSLESFTVVLSFRGVDLVVPLLPSSISKIGLSADASNCSNLSIRPSQNLLGQLPSSLTWLTVSRFPQLDFEADPILVSLLPSTLTFLRSYRALPCSAWHLLPQGLTSLAFPVSRELCDMLSQAIADEAQDEVKSIPFDLFPRSITSLELFSSNSGNLFCGPPTTLNQSYFPPHLTYLKIPIVDLSPKTTKYLPSSITYLEIGNLNEGVCEHLPYGLRTLKANANWMVPNLVKVLPKSLTYLDLYCLDCKTGESVKSNSTYAEDQIQEQFANSFDWKISPLPPKLTHVCLLNANELGDSFLMPQQLSSLLQLDLRDSKYFTDLSIPRLSRNLTSLNLRQSSKVTGKSFKFLPMYLTYLNLSYSESIFDSDIQHLPRTLKTAYLSRAIHLTELCVPDLPPQLELLRLSGNSNITPSSASYFPYPIRSCAADRVSLQLEKWCLDRGVIRQK